MNMLIKELRCNQTLLHMESQRSRGTLLTTLGNVGISFHLDLRSYAHSTYLDDAGIFRACKKKMKLSTNYFLTGYNLQEIILEVVPANVHN